MVDQTSETDTFAAVLKAAEPALTAIEETERAVATLQQTLRTQRQAADVTRQATMRHAHTAFTEAKARFAEQEKAASSAYEASVASVTGPLAAAEQAHADALAAAEPILTRLREQTDRHLAKT